MKNMEQVNDTTVLVKSLELSYKVTHTSTHHFHHFSQEKQTYVHIKTFMHEYSQQLYSQYPQSGKNQNVH